MCSSGSSVHAGTPLQHYHRSFAFIPILVYVLPRRALAVGFILSRRRPTPTILSWIFVHFCVLYCFIWGTVYHLAFCWYIMVSGCIFMVFCVFSGGKYVNSNNRYSQRHWPLLVLCPVSLDSGETQRFLLTLQSCWRSQQVFWENTKLKFFSWLSTRVGFQPRSRPVNSHKTRTAGKVLSDQTPRITPWASMTGTLRGHCFLDQWSHFLKCLKCVPLWGMHTNPPLGPQTSKSHSEAVEWREF